MKKINVLILFLLLLFLFACKKDKEPNKHALVKVFDQYLYQEDLATLIPQGTSSEDSIRIVENYLDSWVKNQLMLHYANQYLQEKMDEINKQIEDFKNYLLIHEFKDLLFEINADTINNQDIENYYNEHGNDFILQHSLVKGFMFKLPKDSPDLKDFLKNLENSETADIDVITAFIKSHSGKIDNFSNEWRKLPDIMMSIPIAVGNEAYFLQQGIHEVYDDSTYYYVNFTNYVLKGNVAPIDYVKATIIKVLQQKQQTNILNKFQEEKYNEAIKKGDIEYLK
jgi:hypothetical protein